MRANRRLLLVGTSRGWKEGRPRNAPRGAMPRCWSCKWRKHRRCSTYKLEAGKSSLRYSLKSVTAHCISQQPIHGLQMPMSPDAPCIPLVCRLSRLPTMRPSRSLARALISWISRHPTLTNWEEISRVLRPGGTYFSQQVGAGTNRELTNLMMGPRPVSDRRSPERATDLAAQANLEVVDLREASLRVVFYDVGAVVYFLRKVPWTVPGFSVDAYRAQLAALHEQIERVGTFVSHSQRFLIEAKKKGESVWLHQ